MAFLFSRNKNHKPENRTTHEPEGNHPTSQIRWETHDLEEVKAQPQPAFTGFNSPPGRF